MNNRQEIHLRGNCLKLLAACLYEPDKSLLVEERVCENIEAMLHELGREAGEAAAMAIALRELSQDQLSIDYAALFVGPFALIAAPYGSVYMDQGRRVMGDSTLGVGRCYQDAGLSVDVGEPPDHVVIELEFMYYLANREASAVADGLADEAAGYREKQSRFFFQYLRPWIFEFCHAIHAGTTNIFYRSLADCLRRFMMYCEQVYTGIEYS